MARSRLSVSRPDPHLRRFPRPSSCVAALARRAACLPAAPPVAFHAHLAFGAEQRNPQFAVRCQNIRECGVCLRRGVRCGRRRWPGGFLEGQRPACGRGGASIRGHVTCSMSSSGRPLLPGLILSWNKSSVARIMVDVFQGYGTGYWRPGTIHRLMAG